MPQISAFYGIGIWMYWNEATHMCPHFHARYGAHQASISLDGRIIAGWLPARAVRLVRDWAILHRVELLANWKRARDGNAVEKIDPLP